MKNYLNFLVLIGIVAMGVGVSLRFRDEFDFGLERARRASAQFVDVVERKVFLSETKEFLRQTQNRLILKEINLLFVGDIMLSREIGKMMKNMDNYIYPFFKIADYTKEADLVFGNLEGPISNRGRNQGSVYSFRADPRVVEGLKFAGFDILSLANNHIWDWGSEALADTLNILKSNNISPIGAGANEFEANEPFVIIIRDTKIVYLAYTNLYPESLEARGENLGISNFDLDEIKKKIRELKLSGANIVIVSMHWGDEYQLQFNEIQKKIGRALVEFGADLIIGHHSHVVQEIEKYRNSHIAYSLGNFIFDQDFSQETMEGLMLKVILRNNHIEKVEPIKIRISENFQPYISP